MIARPWDDFGWGHWATGLVGGLLQLFAVFVILAIAAGLIFLLVRYLLVATRAAQIYVAQHEPPRQHAENTPPPAGPTSPAASPAAAPVASAPKRSGSSGSDPLASSAPASDARAADVPPVSKPSSTRATTGVTKTTPMEVATPTAPTTPLGADAKTKPSTKRTPKTPPSV